MDSQPLWLCYPYKNYNCLNNYSIIFEIWNPTSPSILWKTILILKWKIPLKSMTCLLNTKETQHHTSLSKLHKYVAEFSRWILTCVMLFAFKTRITAQMLQSVVTLNDTFILNGCQATERSRVASAFSDKGGGTNSPQMGGGYSIATETVSLV